MPALKTKTGRLTAYGLACGYKEQKTTDSKGRYGNEGLDTELYHEHGVYHVRQHDRRPFSQHEGPRPFRVFWERFTALTTARKLFNKQPGRIVSK